MWGRQYQVSVAVYECSFLLGIAAPEYKDDVFPTFGKLAYGSIGKLFPSPFLVRAGLRGAYGERGVEQQHSLVAPACEVTVLWNWGSDVALYLLEDIHQ